MSPSPRYRHQEIVGNIFFAILGHLRKHPAGKVVISPSDVELSAEDVYEPDIYFISQERLGIITEQGASGGPDLVVEVLSPGTARLDLAKREIYAAAGVKEMWLVDDRRRKVDIYMLQEAPLMPVRTALAGDMIETPLIPGLKVDVREIFES